MLGFFFLLKFAFLCRPIEEDEFAGSQVPQLQRQLTLQNLNREFKLEGTLNQGSMIQVLGRNNYRQRHSQHLRQLISNAGLFPNSLAALRSSTSTGMRVEGNHTRAFR